MLAILGNLLDVFPMFAFSSVVGSVTSLPVVVTPVQENVGLGTAESREPARHPPPRKPAEGHQHGIVPSAHSTHPLKQFGDFYNSLDSEPLPQPVVYRPKPDVYPKLTFSQDQIVPEQRDFSRVLAGPVPIYPMTQSPHGIAVIINNSNFTCHSDHKGTKFDAENLKRTFRFLNYRIYEYTNCTAVGMVKIFERLRGIGMDDDSFVCCMLSHGRLGEIIGSDSVGVSIHKLTDRLSDYNCPGLAGKPKLFFVQACREEGGTEGSSQIKSGKDFLFSYATPPGKVAYRDIEHGSWYISELCKALCRFGRSSQLSDILLRVHDDVDKMYKKYHIHQQFCVYETSLRKSVFF